MNARRGATRSIHDLRHDEPGGLSRREPTGLEKRAQALAVRCRVPRDHLVQGGHDAERRIAPAIHRAPALDRADDQLIEPIGTLAPRRLDRAIRRGAVLGSGALVPGPGLVRIGVRCAPLALGRIGDPEDERHIGLFHGIVAAAFSATALLIRPCRMAVLGYRATYVRRGPSYGYALAKPPIRSPPNGRYPPRRSRINATRHPITISSDCQYA